MKCNLFSSTNAYIGSPEQVSGGLAVATIVKGTATQATQVANIVFSDLNMSCPENMNVFVLAAVRDAFNGSVAKLDGSIVTYDECKGGFYRQLTFKNASMNALSFPALDAGSKDAATIDFTYTPEATVRTQAMSIPNALKIDAMYRPQLTWNRSNFVINIDGIPQAVCASIQKVESLSLTKTSIAAAGSPLICSDFIITLAMCNADAFIAWYKASLEIGVPSSLKNASIQFFNAKNTITGLLTPAFTLRLCNMWLYQVLEGQAGTNTLDGMMGRAPSGTTADDNKISFCMNVGAVTLDV